jgi:hypothetical protein
MSGRHPMRMSLGAGAPRSLGSLTDWISREISLYTIT